MNRKFFYPIGLMLVYLSGTCHSAPVSVPTPQPDRQQGRMCSLEYDRVKESIVSPIQRLRKDQGLVELVEDPLLNIAAEKQVKRLVKSGRLSHRDKDGGPLQRLKKMGFERSYVGENIARISHSRHPGKIVFEHWKSRKKEYKNLINLYYLRLGVAMESTDKYCYAVLLLSN